MKPITGITLSGEILTFTAGAAARSFLWRRKAVAGLPNDALNFAYQSALFNHTILTLRNFLKYQPRAFQIEIGQLIRTKIGGAQ